MRKAFRKMLAVALCATLLSGCGDETTTNQSSKTKTNEKVMEDSSQTEEKEESETQDQESESKEINLVTDGFELKYIKHKVSKDYEGNPCLLFFYSFKNLKDETTSPTVATMIKCFQDGVECDIATPKDELKESGNDFKEIKKGGEIKCVSAFLIKKGKEATIEVEPFMSLDDTEKASMVIETE